MSIHGLSVALTILLTSFAHVLVKSGAQARGGLLGSVLHWKTITGYGMLGLAVPVTVFAMQEVPLKTFAAWTSLVFPLVAFLSLAVLKERVDRYVVAGTLLIVGGIVVFSF